MAQTWTGSLVEMKANIVSGFALNYLINIAILPLLYDKAHNLRSAFEIGCVFTVVSVCRQLFIRRRMDKIKRFQVDDKPKCPSGLDPCNTPPYHCRLCLPPDAALNMVSMDPPAIDWSRIPVESLGREHA